MPKSFFDLFSETSDSSSDADDAESKISKILFIANEVKLKKKAYFRPDVLRVHYDNTSERGYSEILHELSKKIIKYSGKFERIDQIGFVFRGGSKSISLCNQSTALFTTNTVRVDNADVPINLVTKLAAQKELEYFLNSIHTILNVINKDNRHIDLDLISCKIVDRANDSKVLETIGDNTRFNIRTSTVDIGDVDGKKVWKLDYFADSHHSHKDHDSDSSSDSSSDSDSDSDHEDRHHHCRRHRHDKRRKHIHLIDMYFTKQIRHYDAVLAPVI